MLPEGARGGGQKKWHMAGRDPGGALNQKKTRTVVNCSAEVDCA